MCILTLILNSSCFQFEVESEKPFNALVPRERAEGSFSFKVRLPHNYQTHFLVPRVFIRFFSGGKGAVVLFCTKDSCVKT